MRRFAFFPFLHPRLCFLSSFYVIFWLDFTSSKIKKARTVDEVDKITKNKILSLKITYFLFICLCFVLHDLEKRFESEMKTFFLIDDGGGSFDEKTLSRELENCFVISWKFLYQIFLDF